MTREYVPFASEYDTYASGPEHQYFGPDDYTANISGQASPAAPAAPVAPGETGVLGSFAQQSDPQSGWSGQSSTSPAGVGLNAQDKTLADFLGHIGMGLSIALNPATAIPTAMLSTGLTGKMSTSPIGAVSQALTGKGVLSNLADFFGFGAGTEKSVPGFGKDGMAPGVGPEVPVERSDLGPMGTDINSTGGDISTNNDTSDAMYAHGGQVKAFLGGFFDDLLSGAGDLLSGVGDAASGVGDYVGGAADDVGSYFSDLLGGDGSSLDFLSGGSGAGDAVSPGSALPPLGDAVEVGTRNAVPVIDNGLTATASAAPSSGDAITQMLKEIGVKPEASTSWLSRNKLPLLAMAGVLGSSLMNRKSSLPTSVLQGAQNKTTYGPSLPQLAFTRSRSGSSGNPRTAGYVGERNYFNDNALPRAHGGPTPSGVLAGMSDRPRYVKGPGSGREDLIDAKLSNDEYVMDAETVALLGDGSPEHGAKKFDQFRRNIRKHKGRALAKGKFTPAAKNPTEYMR